MAPKITGVNHLVLVCRDMETTVRFYRDLLGLKVKATLTGGGLAVGSRGWVMDESEGNAPAATVERTDVRRLYFLEMADGSIITFAELPGQDTRADQSLFLPNFWPGSGSPPPSPRKMDHLALNVETRDDLVWFQQHLRSQGIEVSEVEERASNPKFVKSIYFYDPDGVPMEIATWDWNDPEWKNVKDEDFFKDPDPVPSLKP